MTINEMIQLITTKVKGANYKMHSMTTINPKAQYKGVVINKEIWTLVRLGVDYQNININKNYDAQPLPSWKQWSKGYEGFILETSKGNHLLRTTRASLKDYKPTTKWYINGKETNKEELKEYLTTSEWNKHFGERKPYEEMSEEEKREYLVRDYNIDNIISLAY